MGRVGHQQGRRRDRRRRGGRRRLRGGERRGSCTRWNASGRNWRGFHACGGHSRKVACSIWWGSTSRRLLHCRRLLHPRRLLNACQVLCAGWQRGVWWQHRTAGRQRYHRWAERRGRPGDPRRSGERRSGGFRRCIRDCHWRHDRRICTAHGGINEARQLGPSCEDNEVKRAAKH